MNAIDEAKKVFASFPQPATDTYNAMRECCSSSSLFAQWKSGGLVGALNACDLNSEALDLFSTMPMEMRNESSHFSALNACVKAGLVDRAKEIYQLIEPKTEETVIGMVRRPTRLIEQSSNDSF